MPCYFPKRAWYSKSKNRKTGKRGIVFKQQDGFSDRPLFVPCGVCIGCRLERSRDWAIRIVHESQLYEDNCFITLTYDDEHLPLKNSLCVSHFQNFMKRFRKAIAPQRIRFLHCGEYGSKKLRPHYHAVIFGYDFIDREEIVIDGRRTFISPLLQELWPKGFSTVDDLNYRTARYVAKYVTKKVLGKDAEKHYKGRKPEYVTMSRGRGDDKGLGYRWFFKFLNDVYPCDSVSIEGKVIGKPPAYYDKLLEENFPEIYDRVKTERRLYAFDHNEIGTCRLPQKGFAVKKRTEFFQKIGEKL